MCKRTREKEQVKRSNLYAALALAYFGVAALDVGFGTAGIHGSYVMAAILAAMSLVFAWLSSEWEKEEHNA